MIGTQGSQSLALGLTTSVPMNRDSLIDYFKLRFIAWYPKASRVSRWPNFYRRSAAPCLDGKGPGT
jgi:hypothetical protein